ncbi:MAG: GNAT family N-acetyltransferase [Pseudomonadota bacterium]
MTFEEMAEIHAACFSIGPRAWTAEELRQMADLPGAVLVPGPGGFALGRVMGEEAELLTIAVEPSARGRGVGRGCLDGFHRAAARSGARSAVLEVAADNDVARALYVAAGYTVSGQRKRYYARADGPAADALIMVCDLT